jgi:hypothetical protein
MVLVLGQFVQISYIFFGQRQLTVDCFTPLLLFFKQSCIAQFVIIHIVSTTGDYTVYFINSLNVLHFGKTESVVEHFLFKLDIDGLVLVLTLQQTTFSLSKLLPVDMPFGLVDQYFRHK